MYKHPLVAATVVGVACGGGAWGDVSFREPSRKLSVVTSSNANLQSVESTTLDPFSEELSLSTTFSGTTGPVMNFASGRIDCQIRPNAISATGELSGAGGIALGTGAPQTGGAEVGVLVTFDVTEAVPFTLILAPRPAMSPGDEFTVELRGGDRGDRIFDIDETDSPQRVHTGGVLAPGSYQFKYKVECTNASVLATGLFAMDLTFGCTADVNASGDLTMQDVFDYLGRWMTSDIRADVNHDGVISVQDVFDFLATWFAGC